MIGCNTSSNYIGRVVTAAFALACGDADPESLTYLPFGSTTSKTIAQTATTTDNTSDDTTGVQSSLVSFQTFELTVNGFATVADGAQSNQTMLKKYFTEEIMAGRQPTVFVRVIYPDITYYAFCNITNVTPGDATGSETVTYSFTFSATATGTSNPSVLVVDTPV